MHMHATCLSRGMRGPMCMHGIHSDVLKCFMNGTTCTSAVSVQFQCARRSHKMETRKDWWRRVLTRKSSSSVGVNIKMSHKRDQVKFVLAHTENMSHMWPLWSQSRAPYQVRHLILSYHQTWSLAMCLIEIAFDLCPSNVANSILSS